MVEMYMVEIINFGAKEDWRTDFKKKLRWRLLFQAHGKSAYRSQNKHT